MLINPYKNQQINFLTVNQRVLGSSPRGGADNQPLTKKFVSGFFYLHTFLRISFNFLFF
jgi:hypothetical protein